MADLNNIDPRMFEELFGHIGELGKSFSRLANAAEEAGDPILAENRAAARRTQERDEAAKKEKEARERQAAAIHKFTADLTSYSRQLISGGGNFTALNSVISLTTKAVGGLLGAIPVVGGALKGLSEGAGEAAKLMVETFERVYGQFEQLADVGVVNTFEDLQQAGRALKLNYTDTLKVLSKSSKELAMLGGSATRGRELIEFLGVETQEARIEFQKLGISAADLSEYQISYVTQQQRYNRGQLKDIRELADGSKRYAVELDALSKLTGVSKKQLQSEQEARLRDARYRAGIASLRESERKEIDQFLTVMKQVAPGMEEGLKDLIASGGAVTTEAGKSTFQALEASGINVMQMIDGLRRGSIKGFEAFDNITKNVGKGANAMEHLTSIVGAETSYTKLFVEMRELELKKGQMTQKEYDDQLKKIKQNAEATGTANSNLAETKVSLYNASAALEKLVTDVDLVAGGMRIFSGAIESIAETMYEIAGKDMPEYLKARRDERKAIEEYNKARKTVKDKTAFVTDPVTMAQTEILITAEEQLSRFQIDIARAKRRRIDAEAEAGVKPLQSSEEKERAKESAKSPELKAAETKVSALKKHVDDLTAIQVNEERKRTEAQEQKMSLQKKLETELRKKEDVRDQTLINNLKSQIENKEAEIKKFEDENSELQKTIQEKKLREEELNAAIANTNRIKQEAAAAAARAARSTGTATTRSTGTSAAASTASRDFKSLADLVAGGESAGAGDYNAANYAGGKKIHKPGELNLTGMTIGELREKQKSGDIFAAGRYQIIPDTLKEAIQQLGLKDTDKFDEAMQDRIFQQYLIGSKRPEVQKYLAGDKNSDINKATLQLAQEFASIGIPYDMTVDDRYGKRELKAGDSYYSGVGGNPVGPAKITPEMVRKTLELELSKGAGLPKAQTGGILSGPTSGFIAELHGTEAIVPLPDGKTIPVEIKKTVSSPSSLKDFDASDVTETVSKAVSQSYQKIQETTSRSSEKFDAMTNALLSMNTKLDSVIDALITGNRIQRNLLNNTAS